MSERIDRPREGYYRTRLVRGGLYVGVRFYFDIDGHLRVEVDGRNHRVEKGMDGAPDQIVPLDPHEVWPYVGGEPISRKEFDFLARRRDWARQHQPDHPAANARQPIDIGKLPPRF